MAPQRLQVIAAARAAKLSALVGGSFSRALQAALLDALQQALDGDNWEGVTRSALLPGTIVWDARAGRALLPLQANFSPDRDLFLKIAVG